MTVRPDFSRPKQPSSQDHLKVALAYLKKHPTRYLFPTINGKRRRPAFTDNLDSNATNDPATLTSMFNDAAQRSPNGPVMFGVAVKKSGLVNIDVDSGDGKVGASEFAKLRAATVSADKIDLTQTEIIGTPSGGRQYVFKGEHRFNNTGALGKNVDVPGFFMIPGQWRGDKPTNYTLVRDVEPAPLPPSVQARVTPPRIERPIDYGTQEPVPLDLFKRMLAATKYDSRNDYMGWLTFSMAVHDAANGEGGDYVNAWLEWCANDPSARDNWSDAENIEHWDSFGFDQPNRITRGSWFKLLTDTGNAALVAEATAQTQAEAADAFAEFANDNDPLESPQPAPVAFDFTAWDDPDPTKQPPRDWLYDKHLIRKFVVADIAPGGTVKTSNMLVEAVAMASGCNLLNVDAGRMYFRPLKVAYWSGEDTPEEIIRRVAAIVKYYSEPIDAEFDATIPEDQQPRPLLTPEGRARLRNNLFIDTGRKMPIKLVTVDSTGTKIATPVVEGLVAAIKARKIDVFMCDPFVDCHSVNENDNTAIEAVVSTWRQIVERGDCCVNLAHHSRKPGKGKTTETDANDSRGASALIDAVRSARVFNVMDDDEAAENGISLTERYRYLKVGNGKPNMARRDDATRWLYIESVNLGNATPTHPADDVGVVTRYKPVERSATDVEQARTSILEAARQLCAEGVRITQGPGAGNPKALLVRFRGLMNNNNVTAKQITAALLNATQTSPPTWRYTRSRQASVAQPTGYDPI